jgi:hypothetical protein
VLQDEQVDKIDDLLVFFDGPVVANDALVAKKHDLFVFFDGPVATFDAPAVKEHDPLLFFDGPVATFDAPAVKEHDPLLFFDGPIVTFGRGRSLPLGLRLRLRPLAPQFSATTMVGGRPLTAPTLAHMDIAPARP